MAPTNEVDKLTARVVLNSGQRTGEVSVDLRGQSSQRAGPENPWGYDSTDGNPSSIEVSTYIERAETKITFFVRDLHGQNKTITMSPNAHVEDLKDKLSKDTRAHRNDYWLEFQGKPLDDNYTLRYYHVENNSHLSMKGRVRGG